MYSRIKLNLFVFFAVKLLFFFDEADVAGNLFRTKKTVLATRADWNNRRKLHIPVRMFPLFLILLERWKWKTNTSLSDYRAVGLSGCRTIGMSDYSYARNIVECHRLVLLHSLDVGVIICCSLSLNYTHWIYPILKWFHVNNCVIDNIQIYNAKYWQKMRDFIILYHFEVIIQLWV
jgi:hypothetical protein